MLAPTPRSRKAAGTIPAQAGVGLRGQHYRDVLETRPAVGWFEVHSENYFGEGGAPLHYLEQIRNHYPISLHGVGMSLGSTDGLNSRHADHLKRLIQRFEPGLVSEHLCWSSVGGRYLNDLLPLPYTEEALFHIVQRIEHLQESLGRRILIENVSSYLQFEHSTIPEWEFLVAVARHAGCGILLDVNNVYVSAMNHRFDALTYLRAVPKDLVQEIHLAGFAVNRFEDGEMLVDTHSRPVADAVWKLYRYAVQRFGRVPTLIEWDADIPPLEELVAEAQRADCIMEQCHAYVA